MVYDVQCSSICFVQFEFRSHIQLNAKFYYRLETELFKSKNTKYSQVISRKDVYVDSHPNINQADNGEVRTDNVYQKSSIDLKSPQMSPTRNKTNASKNVSKGRKVNLLAHRDDKSNKLISR